MTKAKGHESFFDTTAGATTTRKTEGANPDIPDGLRLRQASVELPVSSAPCLVVIQVMMKGKAVPLRTGWVRGGPTPGAIGALIWHGDLPTVKDMTFFIVVENDTGGNLRFSLHWVTEEA